MSIVDSFLKKMRMVSDENDDYDDDSYDDYDDYDDDDEILSRRPVKAEEENEDPDDGYDDELNDYEPPKKASRQEKQASSYTQAPQPQKASNVLGLKRGNAEVCMIMPKSFEDANTIADVLLSHKAVLLNLEGIDMVAAQRIIDFASGACYTVGGNLQKVSKKIFIVVPPDMNLSGDFDSMIGDMVDLNAVNIMQ